MSKIKEVDLSNVNLDNVCLHFTQTSNIESIFALGLEPRIGEHSKGIEQKKKSYFAIGADGALEICNVWIKWLIYKIMRREYTKASSPQEYQERLNQFFDDFATGAFFKDEDVKSRAFDQFYEFLSDRRYLVLDLEEGVDYSLTDEDEAKQSPRIDVLKMLYGDIDTSDEKRYAMERWNMQTKENLTIPSEKIRLLHDQDEYSALHIMRTLYDRQMKSESDLKIEMLDEFIRYVDSREKELTDGMTA